MSHSHAVSAKIDIAELFSSLPITPVPAGERDDYFTTNVFGLAVVVPDYQGPAQPSPARGLTAAAGNIPGRVQAPISPRPAVAPGTSHVSLVERYIPASTPHEWTSFFDTTGARSMLQDRLAELHGGGGVLLFIYPTKDGVTAFMDRFLDKTLSPKLRQMVSMGDLKSEICNQIENSSGVEEHWPYEELARGFGDFCELISSRSPLADRFQTPGTRTVYSVEHRMRRIARIPPEILANWWCTQEKSRIRKVIADSISANPSRPRSFSAPTNTTGLEPASVARLRQEEASDGASSAFVASVLDGVMERARAC